MIAKAVWARDIELTRMSYEVHGKLMTPDEIDPALAQPTRIQEEPEKFYLIKKLEANRAKLKVQLDAAKLLRNTSLKVSHSVATSWPVGDFGMKFARAITCAQEKREYFSWKMKDICDERYEHFLPGHIADEPEEMDVILYPPRVQELWKHASGLSLCQILSYIQQYVLPGRRRGCAENKNIA